MSHLGVMLITMFFLVIGAAVIGGIAFILLDLMLRPVGGNDSDREF